MHFLSKLHDNSILTGSVDSYCLVCDNYLRSEDEAFTHTEKPIHKKNMGAAGRVEKFLEDRIIKVKKGYYCPFCNLLLATIAKVSIHIADTNHQENKLAQALSRLGDHIIAFDEVVITLQSWHGLMDDTCVICNMEIDQSDVHRSDNSHMLKLVQSKCEFGIKFLYRTVDEDSFFCLICGNAFSVNEKSNHHENISHKNLYDSGKQLKRKLPPLTDIKTTPPKIESSSDDATNKPNATKIDEKSTTKKPNIAKIDEKSTEQIDRKIMVPKKPAKADTDKAKPKVEGELTTDMDSVLLADGKYKASYLSADKEIVTLFGNAVSANIAAQNQKTLKPVQNDKSEKEIQAKKELDAQRSVILDRVEEFQKKGINIDFTWDRARCTQCNTYVPFDASAIDGHIEKQHNIKNTTDNKPNLDLIKEANKTNSNDVKLDAKKSNDIWPINSTTNNVRVDTSITTKKDSKKPPIKVDNSVVLLKHTQLTEDKVESRTGSKKNDSKEKPKADTKKTKNVVEPKADTKKADSKIDLKKVDNKLEPKANSNKTDNGTDKMQTTTKSANSNKEDTKAKKQVKPVEPKVDTKKELEAFANDNNMVVMPNEVYCPICQVTMSLNIATMKAHADLDSHKDNKSSSMLGKKTSECMKTFIRLESNLGSDIVLNNKYMLRHNSFHFIVLEDEGYKCMLCEANFTKAGEQLVQHMNGPDHKNKMGLCKVLSSLPEEFIREISPDVYHCGYCNELLDGAIGMVDHLSSSRHIYARRHAQWNLERCHSVTRNARIIQVSSMHAINYA